MSLKEQMAEDLDVFVNTDEFGVAAVLSMGGVDSDINVILDSVPDESSAFEAMVTLISLKRSDAPDLDKTALFLIGDKRYGVLNVPDDYAVQDFPTVVVNEVK